MFSIVIPLYNEVETIAELYRQIGQVASEHGYQIEIIFVDDGSSDGSWAVVEKLSDSDPRVKGVRFRGNFGKAAALNAGFKEATGEVVFTMDADLQDDPSEIPKFLAQLEKDLDVVSGWKRVRHDPWHKVGPSRVFNWLVGWLTGVKLHDHNCGFKCYRGEIFDEVHLYGELHRFVPVLAAARGWRIGEIEVNHRPREHGQSKYGVERIVKGFLDLLTVYFLTGFRQRPQHLLGSLGLICFVVGAAGTLFLAAFWIVTRIDESPDNDLHLHERAVFYYSIVAVLLGAQFMTVGFLAELITAYHGRHTPAYSVRQRVGGSSHDADQRHEREPAASEDADCT